MLKKTYDFNDNIELNLSEKEVNQVMSVLKDSPEPSKNLKRAAEQYFKKFRT